MMKALVTGGAGFIGSHLCLQLLSREFSVVAIDNLITSSGENIRLLEKNNNFTFIKHDIVHPLSKSDKTKLNNVSVIFHFACPTGVPNLVTLQEEMLLTCSIGTHNILELARKEKASVIFASTSEIYGNPLVFPQSEEYTGNVDSTGIRSPYEEGKRFSESLVMAYVRKYALDAKIARIFNTYGPGSSAFETRIIPKFLRLARDNKPLPVEGDGTQTRTFCYVDDLVDGILRIYKKGSSGGVYNVGSDREVPVALLAEKIIALTGSKSRVEYIRRPSHDHNRRLPLLNKIRGLGWNPVVDLEEGLRKTSELLA